jgi:hypothetical protein
MANEQKIVGVFYSEQEAVNAIESLKEQGYSSNEISVLSKNKEELAAVTKETGTKAPEGAASGAATGGVLGGVTGLLAGIGLLAIPGVGPILAAGPIVATLTGAVVGAGAGGLVGALIGLGIPEIEAKQYDSYINDGRIIVLVDSDSERKGSVYNTFRRNNTLNSDYYDPI